MTDFYLNMPDAETFETLKDAVPFEYGEAGTLQSNGWSIDVIGDGQVTVSGWTKEGEPIYLPMEGFLVNLRSGAQLPDHLIQYQVFPTSPIRVWA